MKLADITVGRIYHVGTTYSSGYMLVDGVEEVRVPGRYGMKAKYRRQVAGRFVRFTENGGKVSVGISDRHASEAPQRITEPSFDTLEELRLHEQSLKDARMAATRERLEAEHAAELATLAIKRHTGLSAYTAGRGVHLGLETAQAIAAALAELETLKSTDGGQTGLQETL